MPAVTLVRGAEVIQQLLLFERTGKEVPQRAAEGDVREHDPRAEG